MVCANSWAVPACYMLLTLASRTLEVIAAELRMYKLFGNLARFPAFVYIMLALRCA